MFSEKIELPKGKISLGRILAIHKMTWPFVTLYFLCTNQCVNSIRMSLMSGYFSAYGILWVVKSNTFYDSTFYYKTQYQYNIIGAISTYVSVSVYYLFPWVTSHNCSIMSNSEIYMSSMLFSIGGFLHYAADSQKFYSLKYRPNKLITEDLFSLIRHPNYLGEFIMWIALVLVSGYNRMYSYIPLIWLFVATILVGIPQKSSSLKRYDEYVSWTEKTYNLIPYVY